MTQPVEPNVNPAMPPVSSPQGQGNLDDEVRQLAAALAPDPVTAMSGHKGEIDSVDLGDASTAPSVTVNIGGVLVPGVAIAANYTPQPGDTVVLAKQGNSYVALFRINAVGSKSDEAEGGWITASLDSSHAVQGSATVMYRRINDHGSWKMQWKGAVDYGAGDSNLLASALDAEYRPSVPRQVPIARSVTGGESAARLDANTDGTLTFWGLTRTNTSSTDGVSNHTHGGSTGFAGDSHGHSHNGAVAFTSFAESHSHSISSTDLSHSHSVSITDPPWVSLDGVEYFL